MKTKTLAFTTTLSLFALSPLGFSAQKATPEEQMFITKAADGGMMEVELGKIAAKNGESKEVKAFGKQMDKDHSKANGQLKTVASKLDVKVPAKLTPEHQAEVDKLAAMKGAAFDKAYVTAMVKDHKHDVAEFKKASKEAKDADLKKFVDETLPVITHHLEMVMKMDK